MHLHQKTREAFFSTLRHEVLQIVDLPLINSENIHHKSQQNEKEGISI